MLKLFFIFLPLFSFASPLPPHKNPKTLRTEHFDVVYYAEQQELAQHYALQLEKAFLFLNGVFISHPTDRIIVVLNDSTDLSNGFATRIPYPYSMLFPVLPDLNDSLSEVENWSLELATHELAHVLSFEPVSGPIKAVRSVFGTIVAPNLLLPLWWKEGLSVWTETAIGHGGRLRSVYQEATLRAWYGERNFLDFTVAQANEVLPDWPWGSRPYLFGSMTMSYLIHKHGEKVMTDITEKHGGYIPYLYLGITKETMGQSYTELYNESQQTWEKKAGDQIQMLSQVPFDQPIAIDTQDINVRSPTISADGKKLAWVASDERVDTRIKVSKLLENGQMSAPDEVVEETAIREVRFFPKSDKLIYNSMKFASSVELYSDLFVYDFEKKKKTRLTKGLRGREAQVNPDETKVVFVGLEGGKTHLRTLTFEHPIDVKTLVTSKFDERIASPQFLDSDRILYSFLSGGKESFYIYDLRTEQSQALPQYGSRMRRPLVVNGQVYFLSNQNRVFNLYKYSDLQKGSVENKTHVKTTLLDYAVSPTNQDVYASLLTANGPRIFHFPQSLLQNTKRALPAAQPMMENDSFTKLATPGLLESTPTEEVPRSYKLWPHYWIPFVSGSSAEDGVIVSISTSGQDPTIQHSYEAQVTYDTGLDEASYDFLYSNRTLEWPWMLQSTRLARAFVANTDELYYNQVHAVAFSPDTSKFSENWSTNVAYLYSKYEDDFRHFERSGPQVSFSYSNVKQNIWMISPEKGASASVGWTHYLKSSDLQEHNQYRLKGSVYWSHWLPKHHAIALEARALMTDRKIPSILGDSSTVYSSELTSSYLIRGYLEGQFTGRNIANANLEYRFPISSYTKGFDTVPFYIRRVHGALAVDAITLDGTAFKEPIQADVVAQRGIVFSSAGLEARVDTTVGYLLPIQWVIGAHKALQKDYREDVNFLFQVKADIGF